jgi:transposase
MKVHANAPLGPKGRETMVLRVLEQGWSRTQAAEAAGVSERTCSKWIKRTWPKERPGCWTAPRHRSRSRTARPRSSSR